MKGKQREAVMISAAATTAALLFLASRKRGKNNMDDLKNDVQSINLINEEEEEEESLQQAGESSNSRRLDEGHVTSVTRKQSERDASTQQIPSHILRERVKEKRRNFQNILLAMKSPMYDNIDMLDPDGELLCKISSRKARWYVSKELADWIEGEKNENTIQLRFHPKGRSNTGSVLYTQSDKENVCVSCGKDKHLVRHYIVPYTYRTLMPERYKSRMSHDIVILCCRCNEHCEKQKQQKMTEIEAKYEPHNGYQPQIIKDQSMYKIRGSALALKNYKNKMPAAKIVEHTKIVQDFLLAEHDLNVKETELDDAQLEIALSIECQFENPNYVSRSEIVVASVERQNKLSTFIKVWREHFLETCNPRFMPEGWSVDNPVTCDERSPTRN